MSTERLVTRAHTVAEILRDRGHQTAAQVVYQLLDFVPGGKTPREIDHWVFYVTRHRIPLIVLGSTAPADILALPDEYDTYLRDFGYEIIHKQRFHKPVYAHG